MNYSGQQPHYYPVGDNFCNSDDGRASKRRSPNLDGSQQPPSLRPNTYFSPQPSSQHFYAPQTIDFGQTSFDLRPPSGFNQATPPFDARSNIPMQDNYHDPAGDTFQFANDGNSSNQASTPGYVHNWTRRLPFRPPFDGTAPPTPAYPYQLSFLARNS